MTQTTISRRTASMRPLLILLGIVALLSIADAGLTWMALSRGTAHEANGIIAAGMQATGLTMGLLIKLGLSWAFLAFVWFLIRLDRRAIPVGYFTAGALIALYVFVVVHNLTYL